MPRLVFPLSNNRRPSATLGVFSTQAHTYSTILQTTTLLPELNYFHKKTPPVLHRRGTFSDKPNQTFIFSLHVSMGYWDIGLLGYYFQFSDTQQNIPITQYPNHHPLPFTRLFSSSRPVLRWRAAFTSELPKR